MILFPGRHLIGVLECHHISYFENEYYELCFSAGSFVDQITTRKKGTVIWPSVRMFGGSMSLECFCRFLDQITARKIKGTVVWPLVAMFGGSVPCAWIVLESAQIWRELAPHYFPADCVGGSSDYVG